MSEEHELIVRRLYSYAYDKHVDAAASDDQIETAYWQGRKDGLRAVLAELCADPRDRDEFLMLNNSTPGKGEGP